MKRFIEILKFQKEKIIVLSCLVCAAISIIAIVLVLKTDSAAVEPKESESNFQEVSEVYPPDSPYSLTFRSIGEDGCTISGIGSYTGTELIIPRKSPTGERVIGIDTRAFENCEELVSIEIPESIINIGEQAFKGCSSLVMIEVERSNPKFCSVGGILFSKDKTKLICCPAARVGSSYLISTNIKSISDYAFYGVKNIKRLYYEGNTTEFESIKIGRGNDEFCALPITCNYIGAK